MSQPTPPPPRISRLWFVGGVLLLATVAALSWSVWKRSTAIPPEKVLATVLAQIEAGSLDRPALEEGLRVTDNVAGFRKLRPLIAAALRLNDGEFDAALEEIATLEPGEASRKPALQVVGQALYGAGRPNEAADVFRQQIQLDPGNLPARFALARYWHERGCVAETIQEYEQVSRIAPQDYRAWRELGHYAFDFAQYADTIDCLERALQCSPPPSAVQEIRLELAQAYQRRRKYDESIEVLRDVTPTAVSEAILAEAHESLGQSALADESLARARELDPAERTVRLVAARVALQRQRPDDALPPLLAQLAENPADREFRFQLSLAYSALGDAVQAEQQREKFSELDRLSERYSELNLQASSHPGDAPLREQLALISEQLGQARQADAWRRAAAIIRQEQELGARSKE